MHESEIVFCDEKKELASAETMRKRKNPTAIILKNVKSILSNVYNTIMLISC